MKAGDTAPDFELPDETGTPRTLSGLLADRPGRAVLLPGGHDQGLHGGELPLPRPRRRVRRGRRAAASGSARTTSRSSRPSASKHSFDFPLLSDPDGAVATQFGVRRSFGPLRTRRQTFVIDTDRTVLEVVKSEFRMAVHADRALEVLRAR